MKSGFNASCMAIAALGLIISTGLFAQTAHNDPATAPRHTPATISHNTPATAPLHRQQVQPQFTEAQQAELKAARLEQQKQFNEIQLLLAEKKARMNTLKAADKIDLKAINAVIDDIVALQGKQMKVNAALDAKIKGMLTPEQRIRYDARPMGRNASFRQPMGRRMNGQRPMGMGQMQQNGQRPMRMGQMGRGMNGQRPMRNAQPSNQ